MIWDQPLGRQFLTGASVAPWPGIRDYPLCIYKRPLPTKQVDERAVHMCVAARYNFKSALVQFAGQAADKDNTASVTALLLP